MEMCIINHGLNHSSEMKLDFMESELSPESLVHMVTRRLLQLGRILEAQPTSL